MANLSEVESILFALLPCLHGSRSGVEPPGTAGLNGLSHRLVSAAISVDCFTNMSARGGKSNRGDAYQLKPLCTAHSGCHFALGRTGLVDC